MDLEFTRMGIVYAHLIACCVAIGLILISDIDMVKQLLAGDPNKKLDPSHIEGLQKTVSLALLILWITGAAIVSLDVFVKGWGILENPKLQSKIGIVSLLTINGIVLHRYVLPLMQKGGSLLALSFKRRTAAIFFGVVSGVSWFYAAMLGVGRPLNWNYSLFEILAAYPVLIAGGFVSMMALASWSKSKSEIFPLADG